MNSLATNDKVRSNWCHLLLFVSCISAAVGCSNKMSQAEADARKSLGEKGAITVLDSEGIHVATLMLNAPAIADKMDEAMPLVAEMPYLTHVEATETNLTDEHMKTIGGLKRLSSLVLSGTEVGDVGLKCVAGRKLDTLYIDRTKITPAAMDLIGGIGTMRILDISASDVMSNLVPLTKLEQLEWLVLEEVEIDAAAADVIKEIPGLARLSMRGSTIAEADFGRIMSAKPNLIVDRSGGAEGPSEAEDAAEDSPEATTN